MKVKGPPADGNWFSRRSLRAEVEAEIQNHILECADLLVEEGWGEAAALREARRRFGNSGRLEAELMDIQGGQEGSWGMRAMFSLGANLRYALRGLRKNPGYAGTLVLTLALGIGAASSIYSVMDALLLRPLAYREADRLMQVNQATEGGGWYSGLSPTVLREWAPLFSEFAEGWLAYDRRTLVRTDGPMAEALSVVAVTPGADRLLGLPLLMGREFTEEEGRPGGPEVAVVGRAYFERLGADPEILGRTIRLESGPTTIVGVLEGGVKFPVAGDPPDLLIPLRADFGMAGLPARRVQGIWIRLIPGVYLEEAQARANALAVSFLEEHPGESGWKLALAPVGEHRANPDVKRAFWILGGTVGAIFLIAVVNGGNLVLIRAAARSRELAVRRAIGGLGRQILGQLLAEGLVFGLAGGTVAVGMAYGAVSVIRGFLPSEVVFFSPHAMGVEGRTLLFTFLFSLLAGAVLGLLPGLQVLRRGGPSLALASRSTDDTSAGRRTRNLLVVVQVGLSVALLAGAGVLVRSFVELLGVDPGFDHRRVAMASIAPSSVRYTDGPGRAELARRLEEALEAHPWIEGVAVSGGAGFSFDTYLEAEGVEPPEDQPFLIPHVAVRPDYLDVMGTSLNEGRGFRPEDAGTEAVIVNAELAHFLWGRESALGRRFRMGEGGEWMTVVGVARSLRLMGRDERTGPYQILYPLSPGEVEGVVEVAARTSRDPSSLLPVIQEELRRIDPEQAIWKLRTGAQALAEEEEKPRFLVTLMGILAGVAVTLASVGLYGVLAYSVTRRGRELGVRRALGADRVRVREMVVREGVALAGVGVAMGLGGALLCTRFLGTLLYGVGPRDPVALAGTTLLILLVAVAASFLPALRATRVDPVEVLRAE